MHEKSPLVQDEPDAVDDAAREARVDDGQRRVGDRRTPRGGTARRLRPRGSNTHSLTPLGQSVKPWLLGLCDWGKLYQARTHANGERQAA